MREESRRERTVTWELRDPTGRSHYIEIDNESVDDQLYLLRRMRDLAVVQQGYPPLMVRYLGRQP